MSSISQKNGFTLLELMIVIIILGVLAALISGNFITSLKKGRDSRRITDLEQIQKSLEMYYEDQKAYPTPATAPTPGLPFGSTFTEPVSGKTYMAKIPNDPVTSRTYEYRLDAGSYRLYACLENSQQKLTYNNPPGLSVAPTIISCNTSCYYQDGTVAAKCIWAISSPDTTP